LAGATWFSPTDLEQALGRPLASKAAAAALAAAGFALRSYDGDCVELAATDPRVARLVNRARLGPQRRGFAVRRVIEAVLCLPTRPSRGLRITDDRRLEAALLLQENWGIDADDLLWRPCVRLNSQWTFQRRAER